MISHKAQQNPETAAAPSGTRSRLFRRPDLALALMLLLTGVLITLGLGMKAGRGGPGAEVVITADGEVFGIYPLTEDEVIRVRTREGTNEISIENGTVRMRRASCRNQICVDTGTISRPGESILCLPNRVAVEIRSNAGSGEGGYDAIVR